MIRDGEQAAAVGLELTRGSGPPPGARSSSPRGAGKVAELDGTRLPSAESLRREFPTLVFTPDRLAVVKGGPAVRRAYIDRALSRLVPTRERPSAGLRRGARAAECGSSPRAARPLAARRSSRRGRSASPSSGARLVEARRESRVGARARVPRAPRAASGCPGGTLSYDGEPPSVEALEARLDADVARGDDRARPAPRRPRRSPPAASCAASARRASSGWPCSRSSSPRPSCSRPRRSCFSTTSSRSSTRAAARPWPSAIAGLGQTVITATHPSPLPAEPARLVEVSRGTAV